MLKIIYFDEGSALDFLQIVDEGNVVESIEKIGKQKTNFLTNLKIEAGKDKVFEFLSHFLPVKGSAGISFDFEKSGESVIKKTISNTLLSRYFKTVEKHPDLIIKILDNKITFDEGSFTYLKTIAPIFKIVKPESMGEVPIDISKFSNMIDELKGYYSAFGADKDDNKKILRFNIKAFRNNYKLSDLTIMDLTFYAVKTGEAELSGEKLSLDNEFEPKNNKGKTKQELAGQTVIQELKKYSIYDVVLAGVEKPVVGKKKN